MACRRWVAIQYEYMSSLRANRPLAPQALVAIIAVLALSECIQPSNNAASFRGWNSATECKPDRQMPPHRGPSSFANKIKKELHKFLDMTVVTK